MGDGQANALPIGLATVRNPAFVFGQATPDVTVFDKATVQSRCTIKEPRTYAGGIVHVLVNGRFAMRDGARMEVDNGSVLRP